jgi:hypothetical protein
MSSSSSVMPAVDDVKYQFRPSFDLKGGVEFIPGGKKMGISLLVLYRNYKFTTENINVIPNLEYSDAITYQPIAIGIRCRLYL